MFDLSDRPLVWIPIKWSSLRPPEAKGNKKLPEDAVAAEVENRIDVEVELLDRDELVSLFDDIFGEVIEGETPKETVEIDGAQLKGRELEAARFCKVVKNWRKVADRGSPLELNPDNARRMLRVPGFASAFENSYLAACAGKSVTRKGN